MHVLDILAFWKSTADSFQHKFFHNLCFRNAVNRDTSARLSINVIFFYFHLHAALIAHFPDTIPEDVRAQ